MHERYPADPAGNGYDVPYRALRADPWNWWCDPRASERFLHDMDPWGGHCTDHGIYGNAVQDRNAEIYSPADHVDKLNLVTREILTGIPVIRAFSREKHEEERFEDANITLTKTNLFVNRCMTFMMPVMMLIMNAVSVLTIYSGSYAVDSGSMQVGDVMAFIQYAMQIIMSFLMITAMSIMLPRANVSARRINEVLETEVSVQDPEDPVQPSQDVKGTVEFDHVASHIRRQERMLSQTFLSRQKKVRQ